MGSHTRRVFSLTCNKSNERDPGLDGSAALKRKVRVALQGPVKSVTPLSLPAALNFHDPRSTGQIGHQQRIPWLVWALTCPKIKEFRWSAPRAVLYSIPTCRDVGGSGYTGIATSFIPRTDTGVGDTCVRKLHLGASIERVILDKPSTRQGPQGSTRFSLSWCS